MCLKMRATGCRLFLPRLLAEAYESLVAGMGRSSHNAALHGA